MKVRDIRDRTIDFNKDSCLIKWEKLTGVENQSDLMKVRDIRDTTIDFNKMGKTNWC